MIRGIRAEKLAQGKTAYWLVIDDRPEEKLVLIEEIDGIVLVHRDALENRVGRGQAALISRMVSSTHEGKVVQLPTQIPDL